LSSPRVGGNRLAVLAGLPPDHPWVRIAQNEHTRLMRRLGGEASEREQWPVALCVRRRVELEIARGKRSGDMPAQALRDEREG
jgi:hypothetical protein